MKKNQIVILAIECDGIDYDRDNKIKSIVGRKQCTGSGFCFFNGRRDMRFSVRRWRVSSIKKKINKYGVVTVREIEK